MHNSILIQARHMKINIQVFPYLLNNFTYAPFTHLVWPKCSNYVMKVKTNRVSKKIHNSISIQARRMKINIQVFPYLLNNFTYAPFAHLVWSKCSNYVVKVKTNRVLVLFKKKCITPYLFKPDARELIFKYFHTCWTILLMHLLRV